MNHSTTPNLSSPPGVCRHERNIWQSRMLRLHNTRLGGLSLSFARSRTATGWMIPIGEVRPVVVRQTGRAIRCSVHGLCVRGSDILLTPTESEFDLSKGPGSDYRINLPHGWYEPLVMAALDGAWSLAYPRRKQIPTQQFELPHAYADFTDTLPRARLETGNRKHRANTQLSLATHQVHHEGRRLLPIKLVEIDEETEAIYVDMSRIDCVQAIRHAKEIELPVASVDVTHVGSSKPTLQSMASGKAAACGTTMPA